MNEKNFSKKNKWIVIATGITVLILAVILGLFLIRPKEKEDMSLTTYLAAELDKADHEYLPDRADIYELIAGTSAEMLERFSQEGTDRDTAIQSMKDTLLNMNLGLTEENAENLAQWLVECYLNRTDSVTSGTTEMQDNPVLTQLREDLESMHAYLEGLQTSITNNKEELLSLTVTQSEAYAGLLESLKQCNTAILGLQKHFQEYETAYSGSQTSIFTELGNINTFLTNLSTDIAETEKQITQEIRNTENSNSERYESIKNRINDFSASVDHDLTEMNKHLNALIEDLREENKEQNADLTDKLQKTQDTLQQLLQTSQTHMDEVLREMEANNAARDEATNQNIDAKVNQLTDRLNEIHQNISVSQNEIKHLLADMESVNGERMEEILKAFYDINIELAGIQVSMETAHTDIKSLIETVRSDAKENQKELLNTLTSIDASFTEQNSENFKNLIDSLQTQTESMKTQFELLNSSLNQSVADSKTEMLSQLSLIENNLNQGITNISSGITGNQSEILERITQMESSTNDRLSGLDQSVQSVFQRVSNGKQLLASALLTKNVTINEDATFQEIHDGILGIEQQIVIGVDKIPGTIEYEYHHHTGDAQNGGGCYTLEDIHQHVGSCYVTCRVVESGCHSNGNYNVNGMMHCPKTISHSYCWNGETRWGEWVHPDDNVSHVNGNRRSEHLVTTCGKNAGQKYGWKLGCGLNDGQIIGAHIIYDAEAVSLPARSYMDKGGKDMPPVPVPEDMIFPYTKEEAEDMQESEQLPNKTETEETDSGEPVDTEASSEESVPKPPEESTEKSDESTEKPADENNEENGSEMETVTDTDKEENQSSSDSEENQEDSQQEEAA